MSTSIALLRAIFALNCMHQFISAAIITKPIHPARETEDILSRIRRDGIQKRTLPSDIVYSRELACRVDMVGIEGEYYYTETGLGLVCGTYFLADPDEIVEIELMEFDGTCEDSQIEFFDGWAMSAGLFPSESEHQLPMDERVQSLCTLAQSKRHIFKSTQNIAMISFKLGQVGSRLRIGYKSKRIPNPCHAMAKEPSGIYTLRNFGQEGNCSFANIYPSKVTVVQMQVGADSQEAQLKCTGESDFVQFLAGNTFDIPLMTSVENMCGRTGNPLPASDNSVGSDLASQLETPCAAGECPRGTLTIPLMCSVSVVRLTSSGLSDSTIHFVYNRLVTTKNECLS